MATELVIKSWCDVCLSAGKNVEGDTYRVDVRIMGEAESPKPFVVELCGEHGSEIANAVLALVRHGRAPDKVTPAAPARRVGRADDNSGVVNCPACGESANNVSALRGHVRREHDTSLAGVGFYPSNFTCDTCGDGFPNRQGLAAHRRVPHVKQST